MEIVIDIDSYVLEHCKRHVKEHYANNIEEAIANGTPLPKGHGRLIDADYLREDFKASKKISFAERMDISCIVDHVPTIIEADRGSKDEI